MVCRWTRPWRDRGRTGIARCLAGRFRDGDGGTGDAAGSPASGAFDRLSDTKSGCDADELARIADNVDRREAFIAAIATWTAEAA